MKSLGDQGELIAIKYLQSHNYQIRDTNFKFGRFGEIDIIAQKEGRTYFVEVKYRTNEKYGSPEEAISKSKLYKCLKTMEFYIKKNALDFENVQFDVLAIVKTQTGHRVTHYRNIEI